MDNREASRRRTIAALLAGGAGSGAVDPIEAERADIRMATRVGWVHAQMAALRRANAATTAAWERMLDADPDADPDADTIPPEQAEEDRILAELAGRAFCTGGMCERGAEGRGDARR